MFEKEAKEYATRPILYGTHTWKAEEQAFKDGAEFGYNKAKKDINVATRWHKVADGDLPKEKKLYLATTKKGSLILAYYNGIYWETKYNTNVMGHALEIIVAWCELPIFKEM